MNRARRERIEKAIAALHELAARARDAADEIQACGSDEQDGFDNLPEGLQAGETGQAMETNASELDSLASDLHEAIDTLENATFTEEGR
jgi:uncharacterized protein YukE